MLSHQMDGSVHPQEHVRMVTLCDPPQFYTTVFVTYAKFPRRPMNASGCFEHRWFIYGICIYLSLDVLLRIAA